MLKFHDDVILGAIFDMDGTMFDTERLRFQTLKQASQELIGQSFSNEYLMACLGLSAKTAQALAQETYGADIPYAEIRKRADELELESVRRFGSSWSCAPDTPCAPQVRRDGECSDARRDRTRRH